MSCIFLSRRILLKVFLQKFREVSTKHLNSFLKWFKWIKLFKDAKEILKIQKAYMQSKASYSIISNGIIRDRIPFFI